MEERVWEGPSGRVYRMDERISITAATESFKAVDDQGRPAVVSTVLPAYAQTSDFAAQMDHRAEVIAGLPEIRIARVYDWGLEDGTHHLAREFVTGTDLRSMLTVGPVHPRQAAEYAAQVCWALSELHSVGVIHGVLKPQDVVVTPSGAVKLVDFGLPPGLAAEALQTETRPAAAYYAAPELAQNEPAGQTADVYSLGVVLYQLVTGRVPFDADTAPEVIAKVLGEAPNPPSSINASVPAELDAVIMGAMAKDPAERYQSVEEMRRDLEDIVAEAAAPSRDQEQVVVEAVAPPRRRPVWPWVFGGLALIAVATAVLLYLFAGRPTTVGVPNVLGQTQTGAIATIQQAGLRLERATPEYSAAQPTGTVVRQFPNPGVQVAKGSGVTIYVSQGAKETAVPNVVGRTAESAQSALAGAGFEVSVQRQASAAPSGIVISQSPAAGTAVASGTAVSIVVSKGPAARQGVAVPDVVGLSQSSAVTRLQTAGLSAATVEETGTPAGTVLRENPAAGTLVRRGTTITLTVAK